MTDRAIGLILDALSNVVYHECPKNLRVGQFLVNRVHDAYPDFIRLITATEFDPFYDDRRIPAFFTEFKHWLIKRGLTKSN